MSENTGFEDHAEHELINMFQVEQGIESQMMGLFQQTINAIVIILAYDQAQTIRHDTFYYFYLFGFLCAVIFTYIVQSKINTVGRQYQNQVQYIKSVLGAFSLYFVSLAIKMISDIIRVQTSESPWSPSKIVLPAILILMILAVPYIIRVQFVQLLSDTRALDQKTIETHENPSNFVAKKHTAYSKTQKTQSFQISAKNL